MISCFFALLLLSRRERESIRVFFSITEQASHAWFHCGLNKKKKKQGHHCLGIMWSKGIFVSETGFGRTTQLAVNTFGVRPRSGVRCCSHARPREKPAHSTQTDSSLALRNKDNFNSLFHTKYLINMTFKNILPDQHIILKFVTQSKKKKKKDNVLPRSQRVTK